MNCRTARSLQPCHSIAVSFHESTIKKKIACHVSFNKHQHRQCEKHFCQKTVWALTFSLPPCYFLHWLVWFNESDEGQTQTEKIQHRTSWKVAATTEGQNRNCLSRELRHSQWAFISFKFSCCFCCTHCLTSVLILSPYCMISPILWSCTTAEELTMWFMQWNPKNKSTGSLTSRHLFQ